MCQPILLYWRRWNFIYSDSFLSASFRMAYVKAQFKRCQAEVLEIFIIKRKSIKNISEDPCFREVLLQYGYDLLKSCRK